MDMALFVRLLHQRTGLRLDESAPVNIGEEIRKAMLRRDVSSPEIYYETLLRDEEEFQTLVNALTVNETYFFREPFQIRNVIDYLIPRIFIQKPPKSRIRIMSAGCSTGEECYSVVMALMEKYGTGIDHLFSVVGVDIDTEAIERARAGVYGKPSFRAIDPAVRRKYFTPASPMTFRVNDEPRRIVEFYPFNLLNEAYPPALRGMDVVFYRNVSIYFDASIQLKIFLHLAKILNVGGYLVVSSTETLSHDLDILTLVEVDGQFFYRKDAEVPEDSPSRCRLPASPGGPRPSAIPAPIPASATEPLSVVRGNPSSQGVPGPGPGDGKPPEKDARSDSPSPAREDMSAIREMIRDRRYDEAHARLDLLIQRDPARKGEALILKAHALLNTRSTEAARDLCLEVVGRDSLSLAAHLLLGLIDKMEHRDADAAAWFRKALYIEPDNWLAHFYLAEIHERQGATDRARHAYGRVIDLLERGRFSHHGMPLFPFSFSERQILHLCRHRRSEAEGRDRRTGE